MIIELSDIPEEGISLVGIEPAEILELAGASEIQSCGPVAYDVQAYLVGSELVVRGRLSSDVAFFCSRCTERFTRPVADPAFTCSRDLSPVPTSGAPSRRRRGSTANTEKPERVDLTEDIREAILLSFPSHPVCCADCKGLCSQCGTNLNSGRCDCGPPPDDRWTALDNLALTKGNTDGRTETEDIKE